MPPILSSRVATLLSERISRPSPHGRLINVLPPTFRQPLSLPPSDTLPHVRYISSEQQNGKSQRFTTTDKTGPQAAASQRRVGILDQMGATRGVKITVIVFLCIYGTAETIFYVKAILRYFYPPRQPTTEGSD